MSGRFVRASKYRHVFGKPTRKEFCYDNLRISHNAWDTNLIKANPEYLAVNWESSGGGAFAVIPLNERGKLPDQIPLFRGHTAAVLDTDWKPFNDRLIASASDDGKVFVLAGARELSPSIQTPKSQPIVSPSASSLATRGTIYTLKLRFSKACAHTNTKGRPCPLQPRRRKHSRLVVGDLTVSSGDVEPGQAPINIKHPDIVQSLSWSANGTSLSPPLATRSCACGLTVRLPCGSWQEGTHRWFHLARLHLCVCLPFWDDGSNCLYLAGKGDGNIRYFEYENDTLEFLARVQVWRHSRGAYKTVNDQYIEPISFTVPRRAETFQSDIYPPATGLKPAVSAQEWFDGKDGIPAKIDMESIYEGTAPREVPADYKPPTAVSSPIQPPVSKMESTPPPATRVPTSTVADQKASMSAIANKFQDNEDAEPSEGESSPFEEVSRPAARAAAPVSVRTSLPPASAGKTPSPTTYQTPVQKLASPVRTTAAAPAPAPAASPSSGNSDKIQAQSQIISHLATEVETLKKRVGPGPQDQSERIRQLELELEAARS
ncbi:hypothetical protein B0T13DRAFT_525330 [Neurospora crassa]|nr:hypothetical protein B0T13DRAFT_525330 [Neurospora crassa]